MHSVPRAIYLTLSQPLAHHRHTNYGYYYLFEHDKYVRSYKYSALLLHYDRIARALLSIAPSHPSIVTSEYIVSAQVMTYVTRAIYIYMYKSTRA